MQRGELAGFRPSAHGFHFPNRWPPGPAFELRARYLRVGLGEVAEGLCGGMAFAAADRFLAAVPVPPDGEAPPPGSGLFREIARRQLASLELGVVPLRFWLGAALTRAGTWSASRQDGQWRRIRGELAAGRPAMLGLVRAPGLNPLTLTHNHQVLGYAFAAEPDRAELRIYDPNHPDRDDVAIELARGPGSISLRQTTGEPLLALLSVPYRPVRPPGP